MYCSPSICIIRQINSMIIATLIYNSKSNNKQQYLFTKCKNCNLTYRKLNLVYILYFYILT